MWYLYILQCENGSYYIGVTQNVERRFNEHLKKIGALYTRSKTAKEVVYKEEAQSTLVD